MECSPPAAHRASGRNDGTGKRLPCWACSNSTGRLAKSGTGNLIIRFSNLASLYRSMSKGKVNYRRDSRYQLPHNRHTTCVPRLHEHSTVHASMHACMQAHTSDLACTSAPFCSRALTISTYPWFAAQCSGVMPPCTHAQTHVHISGAHYSNQPGLMCILPSLCCESLQCRARVEQWIVMTVSWHGAKIH